jgi:hypothetical protein
MTKRSKRYLISVANFKHGERKKLKTEVQKNEHLNNSQDDEVVVVSKDDDSEEDNSLRLYCDSESDDEEEERERLYGAFIGR